MPRLDIDSAAPGPRIRGFTARNAFRVDENVFESVLLTPEKAIAWAPPPLSALVPDDLAAVLDSRPEFLLLGTGATQGQPPAALRKSLETLGIGVEAMDSRAAARLWGVLRGEGRAIAAALYPLA